MKNLLLTMIATLLLVSCAVYTPGGAIVVDPDGPGRGGHCPPGQAKKGNC